MNIIKRTLSFALACFFALANADGCERINWYFSKPGNNERPTVLDGKYNDILDENGTIYLAPVGEKKIYLTFDAGYSNENLEKILDVLVAHNAPAVFFILPGIIKNSPDVVEKMINSGFTLGNHSTHHGDMSKITDIETFKAELEGLEDIYREFSGQELSKFFRPPEGAFSVKTLEMAKELGYTPVFWSYAYADWDNNSQPDPERAKTALLNAAHDGMVLLLHPTSATNALILDSVLTGLEEMGYTFGDINDLI